MMFMFPIEFRSDPAEHGKRGVLLFCVLCITYLSSHKGNHVYISPLFFLRKLVGFPGHGL